MDAERATATQLSAFAGWKSAEMLFPVVSCRNRQSGAGEQMEKMGVARGASRFTSASAARATASCSEVVRGVERRTSANLTPLLRVNQKRNTLVVEHKGK